MEWNSTETNNQNFIKHSRDQLESQKFFGSYATDVNIICLQKFCSFINARDFINLENPKKIVSVLNIIKINKEIAIKQLIRFNSALSKLWLEGRMWPAYEMKVAMNGLKWLAKLSAMVACTENSLNSAGLTDFESFCFVLFVLLAFSSFPCVQ